MIPTGKELPATDGPHDRGTSAHTLWEKIRDGLLALSLANACLIGAWYPILNDADHRYYEKSPIAHCVIVALGVNFLWFGGVAWLAIRAVRHYRNRWLQAIGHLLFLALFLLPLNFCRVAIFSFAASQVLVVLKQPAVAVGVALLGGLVLWQHRRVAFGAAVALGLLSPLALFVLSRIALLSLGLTQLDQPGRDPSPPPLAPVRESQPRVVWIIFDETDQRLAFEQRPPNLALPEFDRLRGESLYATNAYPPAGYTLLSMPALISGVRLRGAVPANSSDLAVTLADSGKVTLWSKLPSVFNSARALGVNTALVGWYHPYSRILGHALNACVWHPAFGPAQATTFGTALASQIAGLTKTVIIQKLFADACRDSVPESLAVITNRAYGLVLLHLPPPHVPGIYDPATDQFTTTPMPTVAGYFNNLILADRALGKFRRALAASEPGSNTWLIVSADHSWRESRQYDGWRDLRVPFLVKPPGETTPQTYSAKINTVFTQDLILAILRGEVADAQALVRWLDAHRSGDAELVPDKGPVGPHASRQIKALL